MGSRGVAVFVRESAEPVAPSHVVGGRRDGVELVDVRCGRRQMQGVARLIGIPQGYRIGNVGCERRRWAVGCVAAQANEGWVR